MRSKGFREASEGLATTVKTSDMRSFIIPWDTEIVPQFCTCGTQLVEDARFCHKCAKPTRDEPVFVEEPAPVAEFVAPPPPLPVEPPPIGLKNGLAIRIALSS